MHGGGCNTVLHKAHTHCWLYPHLVGGRCCTPSHHHRYTALLYRPTNLTSPIFSLALTASGTAASGTTSFTEDVALPAGPYRLEIATANVHGAGAKSDMTGDFIVGEPRAHPCGCAAGQDLGCSMAAQHARAACVLMPAGACPLPRRHLQRSRHQQRKRRHQRCRAQGAAPRHHGRRCGGHLPHPSIQR